MRTGIYGALAGALLFGASTPVAKLLIGELSPVLLAGLLYAGSGIGLGVWLAVRRARSGNGSAAALPRSDYPWLAGTVVVGGVIAPVLLMLGLERTQASAASLLLNLEGVFTALLAWFAFRENFDRRILLGMLLIVCGGVLLAWQPGTSALSWPALAIVGACACWALDNNLTRRISCGDAVLISAVKGVVAGIVNLSLAAWLGPAAARPVLYAAAALVGFTGYGLSLVLYVVALRHLGTARTAAYFSTAPFIGAVLSFALLGESQPPLFWVAALLMAIGVALHLAERHVHDHTHDALSHEHAHVHDEHHRHEHGVGWDGREPHSHAHEHGRLTHSHAHYPDVHHRHPH